MTRPSTDPKNNSSIDFVSDSVLGYTGHVHSVNNLPTQLSWIYTGENRTQTCIFRISESITASLSVSLAKNILNAVLDLGNIDSSYC